MSVELSPSRINLYAECGRCFWLHVNEGVRRPSGPFPSLPGGMDSVIKQHFDRYRGGDELPPELVGEVDCRLVGDMDFVERCRDWRREPRYTDPETGAVLRGGIDDLLETPDGSLVVLDYKTRGYPPGDAVPGYYGRQVGLYNLLLRENGYSTADHGYLLYYYPGRVEGSGEFRFETEVHRVGVDVGGLRELFRSAVDVARGSMPRPAEDCDFCRYREEDGF